VTPAVTPLWRRAALLGSLWAAVEIILGSFLHNIRIPFAGTILASLGVCILSAGARLWPDPGLLWRAGLICALMKSVSPSAVILGPMAGILGESLLMEGAYRLSGGRAAGLLLGGAFAASLPLIQKIAGLLVTYGIDAARLAIAMYELAARGLGVTAIGPGDALLLYLGVHVLLGATASALGLLVAARAARSQKESAPGHPADSPYSLAAVDPEQNFSLPLLFTHLVILPAGLLAIADLPLWAAGPLVAAYASASFFRYRRLARKFARLRLWVEFTSVGLLTALLLGGSRDGTASWSWAGLEIGISMVFRAALVIVSFSSISIELRNPQVLQWFRSRGLEQVSAALGTAFQALPGFARTLGAERRMLLHPISTLAGALAAAAAAIDRSEPAAGPPGKVYVLTGERGSGKTTLLGTLARQLQEHGLRVGGILSPATDRGDDSGAHDVIDLHTGQRRPLCRMDMPESEVRVGRFGFYPEGLAFASGVLKAVGDIMPDLVIIDEIGPLEAAGGGWSEGAREHLRTWRGVTVLAVRSSLVDELLSAWDLSATGIWRLPGSHREQILQTLLDACQERLLT
jgi:nucleoside-triphosphatase THEP1